MSHDDDRVRFGRGQAWRDEVGDRTNINSEHYQPPDENGGDGNGDDDGLSTGAALAGLGLAVIVLS